MQKGVFNSRACLSELGWRFKVKKGSIWLGLGPYSLWFNSSNKDSVIVRGIKVKADWGIQWFRKMGMYLMIL